MRSYGYNFIVRRIKQGTNEAETIEAGLNYEWLEGGLGDDTLIGSDRSDVLKGGDGNDILQGGSGSDELFGDGGDANIALFSGNRADYHLEWT
jgi:Ca2+-binding RTX toxin-like protein